MTGRELISIDGTDIEISVPVSGSENVMIPVVRIVVRMSGRDMTDAPVLLQKRDTAHEYVRGLIEIPGGRWQSGESPSDCAVREVEEETGVVVESVEGVTLTPSSDAGALASIEPLVVIAGVDGGFPAAHLVLTGTGSGVPVGVPGESADPRWWPIDELRMAVSGEPQRFVPSSLVALSAYLDVIDSGI